MSLHVLSGSPKIPASLLLIAQTPHVLTGHVSLLFLPIVCDGIWLFTKHMQIGKCYRDGSLGPASLFTGTI